MVVVSDIEYIFTVFYSRSMTFDTVKKQNKTFSQSLHLAKFEFKKMQKVGSCHCLIFRNQFVTETVREKYKCRFVMCNVQSVAHSTDLFWIVWLTNVCTVCYVWSDIFALIRFVVLKDFLFVKRVNKLGVGHGEMSVYCL